MTAGVIGPAAIWAALAFALVGVVAGRRLVSIASAVMATVAILALAIALLTLDFSLGYVAETTSAATPWPYRLAAVWGGMDGSMLFYATMTLVVSAVALRKPSEMRVGALVGAGLLLVVIGLANPFTTLDLPAVDGAGLLAILQHPAMIYHPPLLYLGLVTLVVPFAVTMGMARGETDRQVWLATSRRWLYLSWTLLTFGMAAGANWAYVELGWGGFWAWDPVENTALMPWLAATVFFHTSRLEQAGGRMRRWNLLFATLPFALSVVGVYLTRSGATGSIHSFAEDPVAGRVLLATAALATVVSLVTALRSEPGSPWERFRLDRDGWMGLETVLVTAGLVFVAAGSAYPAFVSVFGDETLVVDIAFFVVTMLPIGILVAASLAPAHGADWRVWGALVATVSVIVALFEARVGLWLLAPAAASLVLLAVLLVRARPRGRPLVAQLAHLGLAVVLTSIAGSSFGDDFTGTMRPGEAVTVAGHEITLRGVETGDADRYTYARALLEVDGVPLQPEIRGYEGQALPVAEPRLRSTPRDDVIVAISLLFPDAETVEVSVFVRPLVWWVWVGAAILALAGLVALLSRVGGGGGRRRSATARPLPAGTTSGSGSR